MQLSDAGLALVKQFEGFKATTYHDVAGFPTIGYGHKLAAGEEYPNGITEAQAAELLSRDASIAELTVSRFVRATLTQGQYDALVDFVFNLGSGRLITSTLLRDLNAGQYAAAAQQLLLWDHAGSRVVAQLQARRAAEYQLFTGHAAPKISAHE